MEGLSSSSLHLYRPRSFSTSFSLNTKSLLLLLLLLLFSSSSCPFSASGRFVPSTPSSSSASLPPSASILSSVSRPPSSSFFSCLRRSYLFSPLLTQAERKEQHRREACPTLLPTEGRRVLLHDQSSSPASSLSSSFFSLPLFSLPFPSRASRGEGEEESFALSSLNRHAAFTHEEEEEEEEETSKNALFFFETETKQRTTRMGTRLPRPAASQVLNWLGIGGEGRRRRSESLSVSSSCSSSSSSPSASSVLDEPAGDAEREREERKEKRGWRRVVRRTWTILNQQVYQQIRLHRGELESLLQGVVDLLLQCFRNFFGIYTLGISILLLPLCSSIKKHLDHVNRVPLNDPFLLSQLSLPPEASPEIFQLRYVEVDIPPASALIEKTGSTAASFSPSSSSSPSPAESSSSSLVQKEFSCSQRTLSTRAGCRSEESGEGSISIASTSTEEERGHREGGKEGEGDLCTPGTSGNGGRSGGGWETAGPSSSSSSSSFSTEEPARPTRGRCAGLRDESSGVLRGWWIPAEDKASSKVIICAHGWLANRQACLPFLGLAKKIGLTRDHHVLLFDLSNSGESSSDLGACGGASFSSSTSSSCWFKDASSSYSVYSQGGNRFGRTRAGLQQTRSASSSLSSFPSSGRRPPFRCTDTSSSPAWQSPPTYSDQLGFQACEDLLQVLHWIKHTHKQVQDVSIYAQGVSAMGTMLLLGQHGEEVERNLGLKIDRLILDSPLCSAVDALENQPLTACIAKASSWLLSFLFWIISHRSGNRRLKRMRISQLMPALRGEKTLIIASLEDQFSPWETLRDEILLLPENERPQWTYLLASGSHCNLIKSHPETYRKILQNFYRESSFFESLWRCLTGKKSSSSSSFFFFPARSPTTTTTSGRRVLASDVKSLTPRDFTRVHEELEKTKKKTKTLLTN